MNCLKCGREAAEDQVFCQDCLLVMQRYPVRPGTPVILSRRSESPAVRKPVRRRGVSPEEQVRSLRMRIRILSVLLIAALLASALLAVPAWQHLFGERLRPGQNYSSVTPASQNDAG